MLASKVTRAKRLNTPASKAMLVTFQETRTMIEQQQKKPVSEGKNSEQNLV